MKARSERMLIEAAEHALANPGTRVLVLNGKVNLVIESVVADTPSMEEVIAAENKAMGLDGAVVEVPE